MVFKALGIFRENAKTQLKGTVPSCGGGGGGGGGGGRRGCDRGILYGGGAVCLVCHTAITNGAF